MPVPELPEWVRQRLLDYVLQNIEIDIDDEGSKVSFINSDGLFSDVQEVIQDFLKINDTDNTRKGLKTKRKSLTDIELI